MMVDCLGIGIKWKDPFFWRLLNFFKTWFFSLFLHEVDVIGLLSISNIQKCIVAFVYAFYNVAYALDEYYHLGESTTMEALKCFV